VQVQSAIGNWMNANLAVQGYRPKLRERYAPDLVIANGENSAGGLGITERTANAWEPRRGRV
jgi:calcineurin-like phosphoesterase